MYGKTGELSHRYGAHHSEESKRKNSESKKKWFANGGKTWNKNTNDIEYIVDKKGEIYTYDINTNTNYNSQAEKNFEIKGMKSIAEFLKKELLLLSNIKIVA